jgi:hypothetical protein
VELQIIDSIENSEHETEKNPPANMEVNLWRTPFLQPLY